MVNRDYKQSSSSGDDGLWEDKQDRVMNLQNDVGREATIFFLIR